MTKVKRKYARLLKTRGGRRRLKQRRGAIAVLTAIMITLLAGMTAFSVDYGYLLKIRTDMQCAADAAALAAVQHIIREADGTQDLVKTRNSARVYAQLNLNNPSFQVLDSNIEIGRFDPDTIHSNVTLLNSGTLDGVRVTLLREGTSNSPVSLFFARVLGRQQAPIMASATAVLQKAELLLPGADILPIATPVDLWDSLQPGDRWRAYGDGKLTDEYGNDVPGNWGTLDVGPTGNSTSDLNDQILNGLAQTDLDALYADSRIAQDTHIDSSDSTWMNGDTGLSSGVKSSIQAIHGEKRLIPIYDALGGPPVGNNVEFHIVRWGVVTVVNSQWQGQTNTYVLVQKSHVFSGELRPKANLSSATTYIDGAYTSPVLVE